MCHTKKRQCRREEFHHNLSVSFAVHFIVNFLSWSHKVSSMNLSLLKTLLSSTTHIHYICVIWCTCCLICTYIIALLFTPNWSRRIIEILMSKRKELPIVAWHIENNLIFWNMQQLLAAAQKVIKCYRSSPAPYPPHLPLLSHPLT